MAIRLRQDANLPLDRPIDVFGLCDRMGIPFRFVDINMEGMYQRSPTPYIVLSALRPLGRRVFNCAHELGHHAFGHGMTIDALVKERLATPPIQPGLEATNSNKSGEEFLVDAFAGFILMPALALRRAYSSRGVRAESATPEQHFAVACSFGVGYATLINHLAFGGRIITHQCAARLLRVPVATIRRRIVGAATAVRRLVVADAQWQLPTIDAEVGTHILLPANAIVTGDTLAHVDDTAAGRLTVAARPGVNRVVALGGAWAAFLRVSRFQYVGLGRYRHMDNTADDPDDANGQVAPAPELGVGPTAKAAQGEVDD